VGVVESIPWDQYEGDDKKGESSGWTIFMDYLWGPSFIIYPCGPSQLPGTKAPTGLLQPLGEPGAAVNVELLEDGPKVRPDRCFRNHEFRGDLSVSKPVGGQFRYLHLTGREIGS
jgi:hypothetical protein